MLKPLNIRTLEEIFHAFVPGNFVIVSAVLLSMKKFLKFRFTAEPTIIAFFMLRDFFKIRFVMLHHDFHRVLHGKISIFCPMLSAKEPRIAQHPSGSESCYTHHLVSDRFCTAPEPASPRIRFFQL